MDKMVLVSYWNAKFENLLFHSYYPKTNIYIL